MPASRHPAEGHPQVLIIALRSTVQRLPGVGLVVGTPKTARSRRAIPLPDGCVAALAEHRTAQAAEQAARSSWADPGLILATTRGSLIEPRNLNGLIEELVAKAGVGRIRFHDLRYTCASRLLAQGVPPRIVMGVLGHSQLSMTTDLYGHVMPTGLRGAADAMEGVLTLCVFGALLSWSAPWQECRTPSLRVCAGPGLTI